VVIEEQYKILVIPGVNACSIRIEIVMVRKLLRTGATSSGCHFLFETGWTQNFKPSKLTRSCLM